MMRVLICAVIGYLLGSISPSYILAKLQGTDLRSKGSGTLGATNAYLHLGIKWGVLVLVFDLTKAILAMELTSRLFVGMQQAKVITGCAVIFGHIFPFYLGFKGGKGLACLAAMMMELDFPCFLIILITTLILIAVVNWGVVSAFYAPTVFSVWYSIKIGSLCCFLIMALTGACIMWRHKDNLKKIRSGEETSIREYFSRYKKEK